MLSGCDMSSIIQQIKDILGRSSGTTSTSTTTVATPTSTVTNTASTTTEAAVTAPTENSCKITLYGSSSCGNCISTREYLKSKGIAFADKDVNNDSSANAEARAKCKEKGIEVRGIPIIDVCGDMMVGFDQAKLEALLKKHGFLGGEPTATVATTTTSTETNVCSVTVYGTSSCPWCTKAKSYLKSKGVSYSDKDVGKDSSANQELVSKLQAKGLSTSGVPVIDICGDLVLGYDESKMDTLLKQHGFTSGSQSSDAQSENPGN